MAEIAKINKVNIYQESLGKDSSGNPVLSYTEVAKGVPIGTDINIEKTNSGNIILQDITDYSDGATHFGVSNGVSIDGDKLIANTVETTDLILGTKNIKDTALKEVKLTSSGGEDSSIKLTITGTTLNGNEVVSKEAAVITFPEGSDEKVKVATLPTSISNYPRLPLLIGNQTGTYTGGLYSLSTSNIGYYDVTNKKIFINSLDSNTIAAKTVNGTTSISSPSGSFTNLKSTGTITANTIKPTKIEGCGYIGSTTINANRLSFGGLWFTNYDFTTTVSAKIPIGSKNFYSLGSKILTNSETEKYESLEAARSVSNKFEKIGSHHRACVIITGRNSNNSYFGVGHYILQLTSDQKDLYKGNKILLANNNNIIGLIHKPYAQLFLNESNGQIGIEFHILPGSADIEIGTIFHIDILWYD